MPSGNEHYGLLKEIIEIFHEANKKEPGRILHYKVITSQLEGRGFWDGKKADTKSQTVDSYLSQHPDIFRPAGDGMYLLDESRGQAKPPGDS